jgi:hypothetical protein
VLSVAIAEQVLASGRPLYIDAFGGGIAKALPTYPYGIFFRVLPRDARPPTPQEVFELNQELLAVWDLAYPHPYESDMPAADVHILVSRAWSMLGDALAASGDPADAAAAREVALGLAP